MQLSITGRIQKMVRHNNDYLTVIQTPAPDPYSQPSTYKVNSPQQLGQIGDELKLTCSVRAWVRAKPYTDKETGVSKEFWEQNLLLTVIQSEPVKATPAVRSAS